MAGTERSAGRGPCCDLNVGQGPPYQTRKPTDRGLTAVRGLGRLNRGPLALCRACGSTVEIHIDPFAGRDNHSARFADRLAVAIRLHTHRVEVPAPGLECRR